MFCCCSVLPAHQVLLPEQITHLTAIKAICESFAFCDFFLLQLETFIFFQFFCVFVPDTAPLTTSLINALASPCTIAGGFQSIKAPNHWCFSKKLKETITETEESGNILSQPSLSISA